MICAINLYQDDSSYESTKMKPRFLPFDEQDLCNDYILKDPEYIDRFCINFLCHFVLNQVNSNTNLLDNVVLTKDVLQPTEKPRSVGPHKSKLKKITSKQKSRLKNKKFRSVSTQLCEVPRSIKIKSHGSTESSSGEENILQQRLFYTNTNLKNYPFTDAAAVIPIITCNLTKNRSHIVSGASIPGRSPHSGNNQRFKFDVESPSIPEKDIELFYRLVTRLLFTSEIARIDVQACVAYIFTRMKLPTNYHKDRYLNIDILFVNKIQIFLKLPLKD